MSNPLASVTYALYNAENDFISSTQFNQSHENEFGKALENANLYQVTHGPQQMYVHIVTRTIIPIAASMGAAVDTFKKNQHLLSDENQAANHGQFGLCED